MSATEETKAADDFSPTDRTTLRRLPKRGSFERQTVYEILDEGFVCHVGFVAGGQPFVIPTAYGRVGDELYVHGSRASRMLKTLSEGIDVCVTVTLVDGLVLARSRPYPTRDFTRRRSRPRRSKTSTSRPDTRAIRRTAENEN